MYIKHSTAVPIRLSNDIIRSIKKNHIDIIKQSKFKARENAGDVTFRLTQLTSIPKWA